MSYKEKYRKSPPFWVEYKSLRANILLLNPINYTEEVFSIMGVEQPTYFLPVQCCIYDTVFAYNTFRGDIRLKKGKRGHKQGKRRKLIPRFPRSATLTLLGSFCKDHGRLQVRWYPNFAPLHKTLVDLFFYYRNKFFFKKDYLSFVETVERVLNKKQRFLMLQFLLNSRLCNQPVENGLEDLARFASIFPSAELAYEEFKKRYPFPYILFAHNLYELALSWSRMKNYIKSGEVRGWKLVANSFTANLLEGAFSAKRGKAKKAPEGLIQVLHLSCGRDYILFTTSKVCLPFLTVATQGGYKYGRTCPDRKFKKRYYIPTVSERKRALRTIRTA